MNSDYLLQFILRVKPALNYHPWKEKIMDAIRDAKDSGKAAVDLLVQRGVVTSDDLAQAAAEAS
jgi:hypothetical protein